MAPVAEDDVLSGTNETISQPFTIDPQYQQQQLSTTVVGLVCLNLTAIQSQLVAALGDWTPHDSKHHVQGTGFRKWGSMEERDRHALLYIVVVLLFYSTGIVVAIVMYLKREKAEIEEEKAYEDYASFRSDPDKLARYFRVQRMIAQLDRVERAAAEKKLLEQQRLAAAASAAGPSSSTAGQPVPSTSGTGHSKSSTRGSTSRRKGRISSQLPQTPLTAPPTVSFGSPTQPLTLVLPQIPSSAPVLELPVVLIESEDERPISEESSFVHNISTLDRERRFRKNDVSRRLKVSPSNSAHARLDSCRLPSSKSRDGSPSDINFPPPVRAYSFDGAPSSSLSIPRAQTIKSVVVVDENDDDEEVEVGCQISTVPVTVIRTHPEVHRLSSLPVTPAAPIVTDADLVDSNSTTLC